MAGSMGRMVEHVQPTDGKLRMRSEGNFST